MSQPARGASSPGPKPHGPGLTGVLLVSVASLVDSVHLAGLTLGRKWQERSPQGRELFP